MTTNGIAVEPTPEHLTLLLKHGKSTTALSILPDQEWTQVKAQLLEVLISLGKTAFPGTTIPLPSNPDQIELGILKDRRDHTKGWESIESKQISEVKAGKKKAGGKSPQSMNTPRDLALKDGAYIAYRLKVASDQEGDSEITINEDVTAGSSWDVMFPADEYDEEMEESSEL